MLWDIFCKVIDNHGDIGVCWRLSSRLAARGEKVRLWVDDASALDWMAPGGHPQVQVRPWPADAVPVQPGEVVIEAFGCELPPWFQAVIGARTAATGRQPAWINLEYLTAESFAQRCHGLPSPVLSGPTAGLSKRFFYPGFTARTGGLMREDDLLQRQSAFDANAWLQARGIVTGITVRRVSLFCYEPAALDQLLAQFAAGPTRTQLLVTAGRSAAAVRAAVHAKEKADPLWNANSLLSICWLPLLSQLDFDHLLWACDLNFVRGEDSLVRAIWAGKPFVWQAYPQQDGAHEAKLCAFLDWLQAPASLRAFHAAWNGLAAPLPVLEPADWQASVLGARQRLLGEDELASQLARLVAKSS